MKKTRWAAGLAAAIVCIPPLAEAGPINRACMASGRQTASRELCGCLDKVARGSLSASDRRKAARFFKDPQKAQDIRQSDKPSDEAFWKRYRAFTTTAAQTCG